MDTVIFPGPTCLCFQFAGYFLEIYLFSVIRIPSYIYHTGVGRSQSLLPHRYACSGPTNRETWVRVPCSSHRGATAHYGRESPRWIAKVQRSAVVFMGTVGILGF